jgi:hypothetical protein
LASRTWLEEHHDREHIHRLRDARLEAREASGKSWQMWFVCGGTVEGIVTQIIIAYPQKG